MKSILPIGLVLLLGAPLIAADSPKDTVIQAAKKLADKANYAWKTSVEMGDRGGTIDGKTEKGGLTSETMTWGDFTMDAILNNGKGAMKTDNGWKSLKEAVEEQGRDAFIGRILERSKAPAREAEDLAGKAKELKEADGVYSGDLTETGAKDLLTIGRTADGGGPEVSNPKGSVKFWMKDGLLTKYQFSLQGMMNINGTDRDVSRTHTTDIKDVGTSAVTVPSEAKAKLQ